MGLRLLVALLLIAPGRALAQTFPPHAPKIDFRKDAGAGVRERVVRFSDAFLGTPYKEFPLGEGPDGEFDSDPLARFDVVDCETFVEETLALARAKDRAGMLAELTRIRYRGGVVSYQTRNHFTEADWLPNNAAAGFIRDITAEVAGADTATASKTVSKKAWYAAKTAKDLKGPRIARLRASEKEALVARWRKLGEGMPDERVTLPYLPIAALAKHADAIPSGTIVSLVRADQPSKSTMVSHMGLIVRVGGRPMFREAAFGKKVLDLPLSSAFKIYEGSSWPLLGLNLAEPLDAGLRSPE